MDPVSSKYPRNDDHNVGQPQHSEGVKSTFANLSAKLKAEAVIIAKIAIYIFKEIVGIETFKGIVANFPSEETKARQTAQLYVSKNAVKQLDKTEAKQPSKVEVEEPDFSVEWVGEDELEDDVTGLARNTAPEARSKPMESGKPFHKVELTQEQQDLVADASLKEYDQIVSVRRQEGKPELNSFQQAGLLDNITHQVMDRILNPQKPIAKEAEPKTQLTAQQQKRLDMLTQKAVDDAKAKDEKLNLKDQLEIAVKTYNELKNEMLKESSGNIPLD